MSAASARAEARRKAILSRGSDRLAKLTTSARGEDAPAYMKEGLSASTSTSTSRAFLGEDMPAPSSSSLTSSPSPSPQPTSRSSSNPSVNRSPVTAAGSNPFEGADPSVWSPEQQQQFMRALMGAGGGPGEAFGPQASSESDGGSAAPDPPLPPMLDNPLAALLGGAGGGFPGMGGPGFPGLGAEGALALPPDLQSMFGASQTTLQDTKPPSKLQKYMPLIHIVALWSLLAYFVFWFEPRLYGELVVDSFPSVGLSTRWRKLLNWTPWATNVPKAYQVQIAPFFWAFMSLEVALHSLQIFTGSNAVKPPSLVAMALPHLPPPFPSLIINSLKYIRMLSMFVDDVAGIIVGIGFIIYFAGFLA